jgi:hypothetical protein
MVLPVKVTTAELLPTIVTGAGEVTTPFSSIMSAWTTFVSVTFMVAEVVKPFAGSPAVCRTIKTGMQVLKKTAGELVVPMVATTPEIPGTLAVARPFESTDTTDPADVAQLKPPTDEVISVPLWKACATNWCVWRIEKHPAAGASTLTEVMEGWTAMETGPLVTPPAVAVSVAVPLMGFPDASFPLQTTKLESHTPPQTKPAGEIVAMVELEELKVNVVVTALFAAFTAEAVSCTTCPATREAEAGLMLTWATVLLVEELPPQPAKIMTSGKNKNASLRAGDCIRCPWRGFFATNF